MRLLVILALCYLATSWNLFLGNFERRFAPCYYRMSPVNVSRLKTSCLWISIALSTLMVVSSCVECFRTKYLYCSLLLGWLLVEEAYQIQPRVVVHMRNSITAMFIDHKSGSHFICFKRVVIHFSLRTQREHEAEELAWYFSVRAQFFHVCALAKEK